MFQKLFCLSITKGSLDLKGCRTPRLPSFFVSTALTIKLKVNLHLLGFHGIFPETDILLIDHQCWKPFFPLTADVRYFFYGHYYYFSFFFLLLLKIIIFIYSICMSNIIHHVKYTRYAIVFILFLLLYYIYYIFYIIYLYFTDINDIM